MLIVFIGGSAHSTPHLVADGTLLASAGSVRLVLAGRSAERLAAVGRAIKIISPHAAGHIAIESQLLDDQRLDERFAEADAIVIQLRVGGYSARSHDESFPLAFDMCGDEGLGPGGLAAAWRTWPVLDALLQRIVDSRTRAPVALLTSPVGILTRAALDAHPSLRIEGICELPWVTLREIAAALDRDPDDLRFRYVGVNHLGWFVDVRIGEHSAIASYAERRAKTGFPSREHITAYGAIPLKYLRLHYDSAEVVSEQRGSPSRGRRLAALQQSALEAYASGERAGIVDAMRARPAPWYEHALVPYLRARCAAVVSEPLFLTTRNAGYIPWMCADEVLEIPHRLREGHLVADPPLDTIGTHVAETLESFVGYERYASAVVRRRDQTAIIEALAQHPWVRGSTKASALATHITAGEGEL